MAQDIVVALEGLEGSTFGQCTQLILEGHVQHQNVACVKAWLQPSPQFEYLPHCHGIVPPMENFESATFSVVIWVLTFARLTQGE